MASDPATVSAGTGLLVDQVRELVGAAIAATRGTSASEPLAALSGRLEEPLRVAIAGKVKAGKSTLLNALVGEELAPTGAGECTRIVTWYRDGGTYRVTLHPRRGPSRQVPFTHYSGALDVDLGDTPASAVERLEVEWPSASLRTMTLVDTPGIASLSQDVSARTIDFLTPGDDRATPADAVLYLMRHLHSSDVGLLESFHDEAVSRATPVNAIGVLSRADEVGVGRLDAMESAARIAQRYRLDPKVRRLCQTVLPVAGLLAQSGSGLREAEFAALGTIAHAPPAESGPLLLSADRFANADSGAGLTPMERSHLLERFGLFGVRLAVDLIRKAEVGNASQLAAELTARSGLVELRQALGTQFAARADVLKCRSALLALSDILSDNAGAGTEGIATEAERVMAGAHELAELQLLNALRGGRVALRPEESEAMERILGAGGTSIEDRLGLTSTPTANEIRQALDENLSRWHRRAENPLSDRSTVDAARVAIRTCEGLMAAP